MQNRIPSIGIHDARDDSTASIVLESSVHTPPISPAPGAINASTAHASAIRHAAEPYFRAPESDIVRFIRTLQNAENRESIAAGLQRGEAQCDIAQRVVSDCSAKTCEKAFSTAKTRLISGNSSKLSPAFKAGQQVADTLQNRFNEAARALKACLGGAVSDDVLQALTHEAIGPMWGNDSRIVDQRLMEHSSLMEGHFKGDLKNMADAIHKVHRVIEPIIFPPNNPARSHLPTASAHTPPSAPPAAPDVQPHANIPRPATSTARFEPSGPTTSDCPAVAHVPPQHSALQVAPPNAASSDSPQAELARLKDDPQLVQDFLRFAMTLRRPGAEATPNLEQQLLYDEMEFLTELDPAKFINLPDPA